jgi:hypothetical protein
MCEGRQLVRTRVNEQQKQRSVGSCYLAAHGEDIEDIVHVTVTCKEFELVIVLQLTVVTICETKMNPVTNPNPVSSH